MATTVIIPALISAALSAGASYIAAKLNKPKDPKPFIDDRPPTLALRGSPLPLLFGRTLMAPVIGYDGELDSKKVKSGGGKGVIGGGNRTTGYTYTKSGVHWICMGPADLLHTIRENGKIIFQGPINRGDTPSGSAIETKAGTLYWYWGEYDSAQPVNTRMALSERFGYASSFPGVCYAEWRPKQLGNQNTWGDLLYEVECRMTGSGLGDSFPYTHPLQDPIAEIDDAPAEASVPIGVGTLAAGTWTIKYLRGAMRYRSDRVAWQVNFDPPDQGFKVIDDTATMVKMCPGASSEHPTQAAAEAASAGLTDTFTLATAKKLWLYLDNNGLYSNNSPGTPNPTYEFDGPNGERIVVTGVHSPDAASYAPVYQGTGDDGLNIGHVLWFLLTAPRPYGLAMPVSRLDAGVFEAFSEEMEALRVPCNFAIRDMDDAAAVISRLMDEYQFLLVQHGGVLLPYRIKPVTMGLPTITGDLKLDADPEVAQQHGDVSPTRYVFSVADRFNNYRPTDVTIDDDAAARQSGRQNAKQYQFADVTNKRVGYQLAQSRVLTDMVNGVTFSLSCTRQADLLHPGQPFVYQNFGQLRVASIKPQYDGTRVEIEAVLDQYGDRANDFLPIGVDLPTGYLPTTQPDLYVVVRELPDTYAGTSTPTVGVFRVRGNNTIEGADVWVSANGGSSYSVVGSQDYASSAGTINRAITTTEHDGSLVIDDGPTVTPYNADWANALDLSGNLPEWLAGRQVCFIDGEWFFVKWIEVVSGGYKLRGMKRAQWGTSIAAHSVNAPVVLFDSTRITQFRGGVITSGTTLYTKTQPHAGASVVDLSSVAAVTYTVP